MDTITETSILAKTLGVTYKLLSDPNGKVAKEYGVYNLLGDGVAAPAVFIVGPSRVIEWSYVGRNIGDRPSSYDIIARLNPLPTATAIPTQVFYTNEKHWYKILIPSGWSVDSSNDEAVRISDPIEEVVVGVWVYPKDPAISADLDKYIHVSRWIPVQEPYDLDFNITSRGAIKTLLPVKTYEYRYTFQRNNTQVERISHWYLLGDYVFKVVSWAEADVSHSTKTKIEEVLNSFQPSIYTNELYGYSLSHTKHWTVDDHSLSGDLTFVPGRDYAAWDPISKAGLYLNVFPDRNYPNVQSYAAKALLREGWNITSRGSVFTSRSNPSYRIDFEGKNPNGELAKGAILITLGREGVTKGSAFWLEVRGPAEDWETVKVIADKIFNRLAIYSGWPIR